MYNNINNVYYTYLGKDELRLFWLSRLDHLFLLLPNTFGIIWLNSYLSVLRVHDESYSRNSSCAIMLVSTFLLRHQSRITPCFIFWPPFFFNVNLYNAWGNLLGTILDFMDP